MLTLPLAIFLLTAPPSPSASPERVAARIVEAFRTEDITKLRDDANLEDSFPWYDIKEQLDRTRCITINDHQEILESADAHCAARSTNHASQAREPREPVNRVNPVIKREENRVRR